MASATLQRVAKPLAGGVKRFKAEVVKGFQRGSTELGFPTANMDYKTDKVFGDFVENHATGVYFGWAQVVPTKDQNMSEKDQQVYPAAISMGWNPTYDDLKEKTIEPWILHDYEGQFYGAELRLTICGRIRDEVKFDGLEPLIEAIRGDGDFCKEELEKNWGGARDDMDFFRKV